MPVCERKSCGGSTISQPICRDQGSQTTNCVNNESSPRAAKVAAPLKPGRSGRMRQELDSPNLGGHLPHSLEALGCDGQG
ncbi:hypothetical protein AVEN_20144-1 [Araneus ventricosus]|uniref:Uncharacterized protein n=1 Tax=Araneus ventricosus TaxID=182803 RepID=A0A4Y2PBH5_ARAVE|nr:hypothetical protein AVEN_20144-1 [Araneus ventricosus]